MATLLTHQHITQSLYNAPPNTPNILNINVPNQGGNNFCKDCGVMFESSTSLEVHLSYHKENLLTRWANQDNLDKSSNSSSGSGSSGGGGLLLLNPSSPSPIKRERSESSSVESSSSSSHYFHPMDSSHYPLYNNNTGDQNMQPSPSPTGYREFNLPQHQPPTSEPSNGRYEQNFAPTFHPGQGHPLFSPGHPPPETHQGQQQQQPRDASAEILDLDSHKVHIYQHQQQQQQQQQQGFFHRPYLPHLLPPGPGGVNGWGGEFQSRFSPAPVFEPNSAPSSFYPPPPANAPQNGPLNYEIIRMENPAYNSQQQQQAESGFPPQTAFGHHSPYAPPPPQQQQQQQGPLVIKGEHFSPPGVTPNNNNKNNKPQRSPPVTNSDSGSKNGTEHSPGAKPTKGWKGGETKRAKSYHCPACNKWFTSSGHLKRHYGTTLHKNSMKQLGENAEELFKQMPKGKKGGGGKQQGGNNNSVNPSEPKTPKTSKKGKAAAQALSEMHLGDEKKDLLNFPPHEIPPTHLGDNNEIRELKPPLILTQFGAPPNPSSPSPNFSYYHHPPPNHHQLQGPQQHPYPVVGNGNGHYPLTLDFIPIAHPPTTMYNNGSNGFPPQQQQQRHSNGHGERDRTEAEGPLPPFSSVGLSHYNPGDPSFQPQQVPRVSPPYHPGMQQQQQGARQMNSTPSPHNTSNGGGQGDNSYESLEVGGGGGSRKRGRGGGSSSGSSSGGMLDSDDGSQEDQKVLKCPDCHRKFKRICYLRQHMNSSHSAEGDRFRCSTCGKNWRSAEALSEHLVKHGSDKNFKCPQPNCTKSFNYSSDLKRHMCLHTNTKPFSCDICGKGFIRKDHMAKHTETHRKKLNPSTTTN